MKTITLKTDDTFFDKVTHLAQDLNLSKSELIRRAIGEYESAMRRKELKAQMKSASLRVREVNKNIMSEFDDTISDGLGNV